MRSLGVDLAWADSTPDRPANETGVVALDDDGSVVDAGWTVGLDQTVQWMVAHAGPHTIAMVDAPLVVENPTGMRECEREVGRRYGRWKVSANASNLGRADLAGVTLRRRLEAQGWRYSAGLAGPAVDGRTMHECYPYTTLVGAVELGFDRERPRYKRTPRGMPMAQFRPIRNRACDAIVERLAGLESVDPPLRLRSHPVTAALIDEHAPDGAKAYKHREDLIDAVLCAWTGLLWHRHGLARCQVLGAVAADGEQAPTIVAPARPEQRA